jgi:hypothetical protein
LLHFNTATDLSLSNPLAVSGALQRPNMTNLVGLRITARIDGPTLTDAQALITRASALMDQGLGDGSTSTIWLDPYTTPGSLTDPRIEAMVDWSQSLDRMRTRLPLQLSAETDPQQEVQFSSIQDDGFFWGWSQSQPPGGFFAQPAGTRVFCTQLYASGATGPTLRSSNPSDWVDTAISAGYTAAAGSSGIFSLSAFPSVGRFFDALRQGWTLGEAWFVAYPLTREGLFLVGDPLLTVALPSSGWDLFGPADRLESHQTDPSLMLPPTASDATLDAALQPAEGTSATYLLRHVDTSGRTESAGRNLRVAVVNGQPALPVMPPVWPDADQWPVRVEQGLAIPLIRWDRPMTAARVATVKLAAQIDGGQTQTLETLTPQPLQCDARFERAMPAQSIRFRFEIASLDGAVYYTSWSITLTVDSAPNPQLALFGS